MTKSSEEKIRTRFAPSPTGFMHVGSLRTALFNYLFAKKNKGSFILRIEDTDQTRLVEGAVENIIDILNQFNLQPDEGPPPFYGNFGPYVQSQRRIEFYLKAANDLISKGYAYRCFCSVGRLEELRRSQIAEGLPPRYDGHCRDLPEEKVYEMQVITKMPSVIRQKMPKTGITEFDDIIYGKLHFKNELLDDSILLKRPVDQYAAYPVYNFANVVDDHYMQISHVIRGEEFLSSTPKHALLYKAFGWELPQFAHLPLILDENRQKLSKRSGNVAVEEHLDQGYIKEALLNFIALLGWNPKTTEEIFDLEQLIERFGLEKVNKSGSIFDLKKLDYINRVWQKKYEKSSTTDPLYTRTSKILSEHFPKEQVEKRLRMIWPQILERISGPRKLEQDLSEFFFYFNLQDYDPKLLFWKDTTKETTKKNLEMLFSKLSELDLSGFDERNLENAIRNYLIDRGVGFGEALWPLRVSLSGQKNSPSPFEIIATLSRIDKNEIIERIKTAIKKLD